ncbi:MAG: T9SS type A sorting domain-containing protein [Bacteroidota bacterium]
MLRLLVLLLLGLAATRAAAQPELRLSPDTLRLGELPVGAEIAGQFVLIESIGDKPITIKIHAAFQPFYMPFGQRYRLSPIADGLVDSRAAILGLVPVRTGSLTTDVAVDTDERGAYVVQARATGIPPLDVTLAPGETASRVLEIRNPGFAPLGVRTEAEAPWASLSPVSFALAPDTSRPVTVSLDATGLAAGTYRDTLRATNEGTLNAFEWRVPITLTVTGSISASPAPAVPRPTLSVLSSPTADRVQVRFSGVTTPAAIRVFDARGREVTRLGPVVGTGQQTWAPPSPGLYLLRLGTEAGGVTRRVVVVR